MRSAEGFFSTDGEGQMGTRGKAQKLVRGIRRKRKNRKSDSGHDASHWGDQTTNHLLRG